MDQGEPTSRESRLLLTCAKTALTEQDKSTIRDILREDIDWTIFAQMAVDRGQVSRAAFALVRVAADLVPDDILDALHKIVDQTESTNRAVLELVAQATEGNGVKGPLLAIRSAYLAAKRAVAANPNDATEWRILGRALLDVRRHELAVDCYNRALDLVPEDAVNWVDRATAMVTLGRLKSALADIDKALALDPHTPCMDSSCPHAVGIKALHRSSGSERSRACTGSREHGCSAHRYPIATVYL